MAFKVGKAPQRVVQMAVNLAPAVIGGATQRLVYENNENYGFLTTGGFILGGTILGMFAKRGDILQAAADGMIASGASTLGWVGTEIMFLNKRPGRPAMIPQRAAPMGYRPALQAGGYPQTRPGVSLMGVNENTGEHILSSRV